MLTLTEIDKTVVDCGQMIQDFKLKELELQTFLETQIMYFSHIFTHSGWYCTLFICQYM